MELELLSGSYKGVLVECVPDHDVTNGYFVLPGDLRQRVARAYTVALWSRGRGCIGRDALAGIRSTVTRYPERVPSLNIAALEVVELLQQRHLRIELAGDIAQVVPALDAIGL